MLLNVSNHRYETWLHEQRMEAEKRWGSVEDFGFPDVPAGADEEDVRRLAVSLTEKIVKKRPDAVMCQGEFTLAFALLQLLQKEKIPVVAACAERNATEWVREDGITEKRSVFRFVRFREYCSLADGASGTLCSDGRAKRRND